MEVGLLWTDMNQDNSDVVCCVFRDSNSKPDMISTKRLSVCTHIPDYPSLKQLSPAGVLR